MTDKTDASADAATDTTANDNAARLQGLGLQASFGSLSETVRRFAVDLANEAGARAIAEAQLADARRQLEALRAEVEGLKGKEGGFLSDDQIDAMVQAFLSWQLPADFYPDGGIFLVPDYKTATGTNLLTADQADGMVRHMLNATIKA